MKKIGLIGIVLVLLLAVVGIGYSHWTKTLYIDGTVTTGTFGVEWSQYDPCDNEGIKDVGVPSCSLNAAKDTVTLSIANAYPSYEATFNLDIHGLGTVPAHVNMINVTSCDPFLEVTVMTDPLPIQLHECDETPVIVTIHVLQNNDAGDLCPENAQMSVSLQVVADQFNHV